MFLVENAEVEYQVGNTFYKALQISKLEIQKNEVISVTGPSGAGKSTLLNLLAGLEKPKCGVVKYNDVSVYDLPNKKLSKLRLENFSFIFQQFHLLKDISVRDNIWLPAIVKSGKVNEELYLDIVEELQIKDLVSKYPTQLSGGEQQRVAIARALLTQPKVLFADEPTGNLDSKNGDVVFNMLFNAVKRYEQTLIYVTHDINRAKYARRNLLIKDGIINEES